MTALLTGKTVPAIAVVLCENLDAFHGHNGMHTQYLFAVGNGGEVYHFDDPPEEFVTHALGRNKGIDPDVILHTCYFCKLKGVK